MSDDGPRDQHRDRQCRGALGPGPAARVGGPGHRRHRPPRCARSAPRAARHGGAPRRGHCTLCAPAAPPGLDPAASSCWSCSARRRCTPRSPLSPGTTTTTPRTRWPRAPMLWVDRLTDDLSGPHALMALAHARGRSGRRARGWPTASTRSGALVALAGRGAGPSRAAVAGPARGAARPASYPSSRRCSLRAGTPRAPVAATARPAGAARRTDTRTCDDEEDCTCDEA